LANRQVCGCAVVDDPGEAGTNLAAAGLRSAIRVGGQSCSAECHHQIVPCARGNRGSGWRGIKTPTYGDRAEHRLPTTVEAKAIRVIRWGPGSVGPVVQTNHLRVTDRCVQVHPPAQSDVSRL